MAAPADQYQENGLPGNDVLEAIQEGIWITDQDHRIVFFNAAMERIAGVSAQDVIGTDVTADFPPETTQAFLPFYRRARNTLEPVKYEARVITPAGRETIQAGWLTPRVESGHFQGMICTIRDITHERQAGEKLEASEKRFRILAEFAPMSLYETDASGKCIYANSLWLEHAGLSLNEALGDGWQQGLYEGDRERIHTLWQQHAVSGKPWSMEYRFCTPEGKITWVQGTAVALRDEQDRITGYLGANLDITQRKRAEDALGESHANLLSLVENTEGLIWSVDRDYRLIVGNSAFQGQIHSIRGCPFAIGECVLAEEFEDSIDLWRQYYDRALAGERFRVEMPLRYGQKEFDYLYHFAPIHSEGHTIVGVTIYGHDITTRKQTENALIEREEQYRLLFENMLDAFALHEIILDTQGTPIDYVFLEVNAAFERLTGLSRQALIGKRVTEAVPGTQDDPADWIGTYGRVALTGQEERFEQFSEAIGKWFSVLAFSPRKGQFATIFEDITQRRANSAALKQSEQLLRAIAENYPDSYVSIIEKDLTLSFSSGQEFMRQGLDPDQFKGVTIDQVFGDQADVVRDHYLRTFAGEEQAFELFINEQHQFYRTVPLPQADGSIPRILAVVQNVTARKLAEQALRESETFNQILLNMSPDLIYVYDLVENKNVYSNQGLVRVLGYSVEEIQTMGNQVLPILMHSEDFEIYVNETVQRYAVADDGDVIEHAYRMRHKDGTWRWLRSKESVFSRLADGAPRQIFGIVSDVTQSKNAERALQEQRDRAQQYLDIAGVIILALSVDGEVLLINQRGSEILGYAQQDIVGKNWFEVFVPPRSRAQTMGVFEQIMNGDIDVARTHENPVVTHTGEQRIIAWHNALLRDAQGIITGTLSSGEDITERLRAESEKVSIEAQLRQSQKLESIGTLASGVAHEINNPLMGMINYAELVRDRMGDDERASEMLKGIIDEGGRIAVIVKNLLSFARQDDTEYSLARIEDIVEETLSLLRAALKGDQIALSVEIENDLPAFPCRSQQIRQVLVNLVTNAQDALNQRYEYYDENKTLFITARQHVDDDGKWIRITVEDHGNGIPLDIQERIYDPFFTSKSRDQGTGLGLSVSHGIVKEHGGRMDFETREGELTRFHVDLPLDV